MAGKHWSQTSGSKPVIASFLRAGKGKVWATVAATIMPIVLADWAIGARASLAAFYMLPMMVVATVAEPVEILALAILCSFLRSLFDLPSPPLEVVFRFIFAVLAYAGAGLFVSALIRNRKLAEQLRVLVESSPAAILTTDGAGRVLACNQAANLLFLLGGKESLTGRPIGSYIPLLADALKLDRQPDRQSDHQSDELRTAAQCQGRRENGEVFLAHTWFSSYVAPEGRRLAAIVVDSSEEMRDREEEGLRQLMRGNRIAAAAVSHEVRNLCGAIALVCSNLQKRHRTIPDEDYRDEDYHDEDLKGMATLVAGLEKIASAELHGQVHDELEKVALHEVLADLRIVIEPDWREIGGQVIWSLPAELSPVLGERTGLLQAFLNLAQNSHRAVQNCPVHELRISVSVEEQLAKVRFRDTGPGIAEPGRLFEPFQSGADGSGLGLYVSRAVVRSYGGDLVYEPQAAGAGFRVDLALV
jgi:two-component system sensor kinase FixL